VKKINECIAEKWMHYLAIILISISVVCVLLDIVHIFNITYFYSPYILSVPVLLAVVLKLLCTQRESQKEVNGLYYALVLASVEYLMLVLIDTMLFPAKIKIVIYMITALYMLIYSKIKGAKTSGMEGEEDKQERKKKIFSLYYINTEKVYEIAMLLNNRIVTSGTSENESESTLEKQTNIGINSNLKYLESVKGELGLSQNIQIHNGMKSKVLENFDVKTTKSNMLASIIAKANVYEGNENINLGDLILLKNASLVLLNAEESYAVTKMILNGAFKDTKISSNSDDMKIEFDLSAMINSLLKDCAYELGCIVGDKKFLLTIPMTFENDFENSYNIYDLQVGTVTVVGIYRGKRQYEKRLSLQEIFSENNEQKKVHTYENDDYRLQSSAKGKEEMFDDINNKGKQSGEFQEVIDVIAVIQEINAK
jgi:predicted house-cleaning noncanonical NTP pyrophosphatase (MazG superfamily)